MESVSRMRSEGVDVIFNVLNVISAPAVPYAEMLNQGFEPGDVQFYASDFNSQAAEIVSSEDRRSSAGRTAGALYHGAIIMDPRDVGGYNGWRATSRGRSTRCAPTPTARTAPRRANHESEDRHDGNSRYGMVGSVCT